MSTADFVEKVFCLLNGTVEYAVLRNWQGLPHTNRSRDIDIVIRAADYRRLRPLLVDCVHREGFKIVSFFESERLQTFIVGHAEPGDVQIVQLDFFVHTSAYGHILLSADDLLSSRQMTDGVWHVSREFEFLDKYLYLKYIGVKYPEKYVALKEQMRKSNELSAILHSLYGIYSLKELDAMPTRKFRRISRRSGHGRFANVARFWWYYVKNHLCPRGFSIGFTGPDGSGKTTVIDLIDIQLRTVFSNVSRYHFRPNLFGNISDVAHTAGVKRTVDKNYSDPHRGSKTNALSSLVRLAYYSLDYLLGYWRRIRPSLTQRGVVIFDRYFTDIICDSRRSRIFLGVRFLYGFGRLCIPNLNYNILLTASTDVVLRRKQELDREGLESINRKIDFLKDKKGYYKVLNDGTPDEAVAAVLHLVFTQQDNKNMKRM